MIALDGGVEPPARGGHRAAQPALGREDRPRVVAVQLGARLAQRAAVGGDLVDEAAVQRREALGRVDARRSLTVVPTAASYARSVLMSCAALLVGVMRDCNAVKRCASPVWALLRALT